MASLRPVRHELSTGIMVKTEKLDELQSIESQKVR